MEPERTYSTNYGNLENILLSLAIFLSMDGYANSLGLSLVLGTVTTVRAQGGWG